MVKPIYCNLLLIFSCLIYKAYGGHHTRNVKHIRLPSRVINHNVPLYDSSSSSTTVNNAGENTATLESAAQPSSQHIFSKSFSSNNGVGYDRNLRSVQDNKSKRSINFKQTQNYKDSNDLNNGQMNNDMTSRFSNNKSLSGLDNRNDQIDTTLDDPSIQNKKNSMTFESLNRKPLSGLNNINIQNDNTAENQGIEKRQNSIISDFQDFPNIRQIITNPLVRQLGSLRQNSFTSSLNEDDSQRFSDGNENSSITNMMTTNKNTFINPGQKIVSISIRQCCINGKCRVLKDGEKCDIEDYFKSMKNTKQQNGDNDSIMSKLMPSRLSSFNRFGDSFNEDSNNQETEKLKISMFGTSSNEDNDFVMPKIMNGKLKPFRLSSFNRFGNSFNEDNDTQETEIPKNMRLGSTGYSSVFPSFGSSNGMPGMSSEKIKPNYPYSEPIGVSEDEVNEIRNEVLQKSNFYRNKFKLIPFTLDDQLNNCAQDWANIMAKQQLFNHRPKNVYGENLYGNQDLKNLGETAVDSWYNEMSIFTIGNEENFDTLHMTQLLWKKSTKLGVGVSQNPESGMYYVVANYDPKGNLLDHFQKNLPDITEEDIEEAKEADKRLKAKLEKPVVTSWSSGSSIPFGSGWRNYGSYFN